jgi:alkylated DNA repair dioxygenase AlkB
MEPPVSLSWQPSLFDADEPDIDVSFSGLQRIHLDPASWVDHAPSWVAGSDRLFEQLLEGMRWKQRMRHMYDGKVREPRLTATWTAASGASLEPAVIEGMRNVLSKRYGVEFDSVGFNLYRDGRDSVAWHADRIKAEIEQPVVALVSLGEPRRFLLRRSGGGKSRAFLLGRGDLLVTGGQTQRAWEHSVPKVAQAGPRISLAFRHDMDPTPYASKEIIDPEP